LERIGRALKSEAVTRANSENPKKGVSELSMFDKSESEDSEASEVEEVIPHNTRKAGNEFVND